MMQMCCGCGAEYPHSDGPTHAYMASAPGCFEAFNTILTAEYSDYRFAPVHRLTVDTWAVQHPGDQTDRRAVQSVGLHLARIYLQLSQPHLLTRANDVMLDFADHKGTLPPLPAPDRFTITAKDVAPFAGTDDHIDKVKDWAQATWDDWAAHHDYIRDWVAQHSRFAP